MLDNLLELLCRMSIFLLSCTFGYSTVKHVTELYAIDSIYLLIPTAIIMTFIFYIILMVLYEWAKGQ